VAWIQINSTICINHSGRKKGLKQGMGLYKRGKTWWMSFMADDGEQHCQSTKQTNRKLAQQILDIRRAEIAQGRFSPLKKQSPRLNCWSEKYLDSIPHPNTRCRYASSRANLVFFFGEEAQLIHISCARIEEFKRARHQGGVKWATINRDLRFLAQILKQAEREQYIGRSPFDLAKHFQNESKERRKPHILTYQEQEKLLAVAPPRIRVLTVLGVETGMRTGEMLSLRWADIDLLGNALRVERSKSAAGIRTVPLSAFCQSEILKWRNLVGPEFSEWVFPNFSNRRHPLQGGRKAWASALRKAGIPFFPIYNLRHTFASRMNAAGVSAITIAQMLGHSSTQIVPHYAKVLDPNRFDAMKKLESLRQSYVVNSSASPVVHPAKHTT
jgi:integrase